MWCRWMYPQFYSTRQLKGLVNPKIKQMIKLQSHQLKLHFTEKKVNNNTGKEKVSVKKEGIRKTRKQRIKKTKKQNSVEHQIVRKKYVGCNECDLDTEQDVKNEMNIKQENKEDSIEVECNRNDDDDDNDDENDDDEEIEKEVELLMKLKAVIFKSLSMENLSEKEEEEEYSY